MRKEEAKKQGKYDAIVFFPCEPGECWRPITDRSVPNVKDGYAISNHGRVMSTIRKIGILQPLQTGNGYLRVSLQLKGMKAYDSHRQFSIHRIVMIEFNPVPGYKCLQVNHIDGNKTNNHLSNLEWCTCQENIQHAYNSGLKSVPCGEDSPQASITDAQARRVAELLSEKKYTHRDISAMTNVALHIVNNISAGATWRHIYDEYELWKYKRDTRPGFSDEELHKICQFFEIHSAEYDKPKDLFIEALPKSIGRKYENTMYATLFRILHHQTRRNIVDQYNF